MLTAFTFKQQCIELDCPSLFHWTFDADGKILGYFGHLLESKHGHKQKDSEEGSLSFDRGNIRIPREQLRQILINKLKPGTIFWDQNLLQIKEYDSHVELQFSKPSPIVSGNSDSSDESCSKRSVRVVRARVVVGADGIRSQVRNYRDACLCRKSPQVPTAAISGVHRSLSLEYVGIAVIIGLHRQILSPTDPYIHPLINSGGFYVVDGHCRLFVMPYFNSLANRTSFTNGSSSATTDIDACTTMSVVTMWQLSFRVQSESEARRLRTLSSTITTDDNCAGQSSNSTPSNPLLVEAVSRTAHMSFTPVKRLITETAAKDVWSTPIYDRGAGGNCMQLWQKNQVNVCKKSQPVYGDTASSSCDVSRGIKGTTPGSRVTCIGDACHPMTMFKGQGANQALMDGPHLAQWLVRDPIPTKSGTGKSTGKGKVPEGIDHEVTSGCGTSAAENGTIEMEGVADEWSRFDAEHGWTDKSITTRLRCFEGEMVGRASGKVKASHEAAQYLHSPEVLLGDHAIQGLSLPVSVRYSVLDPSDEPITLCDYCTKHEQVSSSLYRRGITAHLADFRHSDGSLLDFTVRNLFC